VFYKVKQIYIFLFLIVVVEGTHACIELLSNRRLEMFKHVRTSEIDMGIWELYTSWVQNDSRPLLVELNRLLDELTLNVVVRMVAGKRHFGARLPVTMGRGQEVSKSDQPILSFDGHFCDFGRTSTSMVVGFEGA
jgi:hypothetical protein